MAGLSCIEVVELVTDYLDGVLDEPTRVTFEEHLVQCPGCQTYVDQIKETVERLGEVPVETLSPQAQDTLLRAFRDFRRGPQPPPTP